MFDVRRLVVFILESCLESPLDGKCHIYDSLYLLIHYAHLKHAVIATCFCVTHVTLSYCVCLGLYLALMRKEILGEWSMLMIHDIYDWPLPSPSFPLTPALQQPAYKPTSSKRPQITLGYCFLLPFLFLPLCCWTTLFNALFHAHPFMTIALSINNWILTDL